MRPLKWLCVLAIGATPALGQVVFTESFSGGWFSNPDTAGTSFTIEGVTGPAGAQTLDIAEFSANDARLGNPGSSSSGGFYYENGVSGNGERFASGDHQNVYLDYHMPVANGTYTFTVALDAQAYWTDPEQPWGRGYEFYIGDASKLAYGTQQPNQEPTGPWKGKNYAGGTATQGTLLQMGGTNAYWSGSDQFDNVDPALNGTWKSWSLSETNGGDTIEVTSGEVILRMVVRLKNSFQESPAFSSWAFNDLNVTLVPEPTSLVLLSLGALPLLLRRRRASRA